MGQSQSTNTQNILSNILSSQISNVLQENKASAGTSQLIECVGNKGGGCSITGNMQDAEAKINMSAVANQISSQTSQQKIVDELSQAATAVTSGINFGSSSETDNVLNSTLNATLTVASNLDQICDFKTAGSQVIKADFNEGNVVISNNTQKAVSTIIGNCIQKATAKNESLQSADLKISQIATSETKGLDPAMLMLLAALLVLLVFMGPGIALGTAAGPVMKMIGALMGIIFMAAGGVSIWYWSQNKDAGKRSLVGTQFSTLIQNDTLCVGEPYKPTIPAAFSPSSSPLTDAGRICLSDPNCKGFDWNVNAQPPQEKVIYYNSLSTDFKTGQCGGVKAQNLKENGIRLVRDPTLFVGDTDPTRAIPADGKTGDVYVNTKTGRMWWRRLDDGKEKDADDLKNNPNFPWQDLGENFPGWKSGSTIRFGSSLRPENSTGADGDLYVNLIDPLKWEVWKRYSGRYGPLNSDDAGKMSVGPNGGTVLTSKYADQIQESFPGRHPDVKPAESYNWTVYASESTAHKENKFFLVAGIIMIVIGIAIVLIKFLQKSPDAAKPSASSSSSS